MLEIRGLVAGYGPLTVLHGIDLTVGAGETLAIIGANGAGKTTLLRTISGLQTPRGGRMTLDGVDVTTLPTHTLAQRGVSHVPEGRKIFKPMDVRSNLEVGAYCRRDRDARSIAQDLERIFTLFPRLRERARQVAGTLSGGEQQMLAIARALMAAPKLLLLDEPSLGLAPLVVSAVYETIGRLRKDGLTLLVVEQNIELALRMADRTYVLDTGRIAASGRSSELNSMANLHQAYFGTAP